MKKWLWLLALAGAVSADTVRLNDDTVLIGEIVAETESNLTVEVPIARGTILKTEIIPKSTITSFERWTPEQKRVVEIQRAYSALSQYTLNPDVSVSVGACDQAISELQKFLTTYAGSSHEQEVSERLTQWKAERSQVAAGMMKVDGTWLSKEESEKRQLRAKSQALAKQASDAMAAKQWAQAVRAYDALLALHPGGMTEPLAKRQLTEALTAWRAELDPQLKQLEPEIAAAQSRFDQAQRTHASLMQARAKFSQTEGDGKLGSDNGALVRAKSELTAAESQLKTLLPQVEKMRKQLAEIDRRIGTASPPTVAPAQDAPPPSTDVLQDTASWWEKYWMLFAAIAVVGLWLVNRIISR